MIVNGVVFNRSVLSNIRAITFKKSHRNEYFIQDGYLHIRTTADLASELSSISGFSNIIEGIYDPNSPIDWGFFFVENREVYINGFRIKSNVLRDNTAIVSLTISDNYRLINQYGNNVNIVYYAFEDYIFIIRRQSCTLTEFRNAMLDLNNFLINPVLLHNLHTTPFSYPMYEVTLDGSNQSMFNTFSLIPNWRYSEEYNLQTRQYVHVREYWNLEIDFKDYFNVLLDKLVEVTKFPVYHKSENIKVSDRDIAFTTYKVEYQDKSVNAIYRDVGAFETHKYCSARIQFVFQTTDFYIYRGFVLQFHDMRRITNSIGEVCYTPPVPNALPYCATVRWSLDEPNYEVQNDFAEVESERGYYHYTVEFSAEMFYFIVRPKMSVESIQQYLGYLLEPAPIPDCSAIRQNLSRLIYTLNSSGVNVSVPPGTTTLIL